MAAAPVVLDVAELERADPRAPAAGSGRRRFCCILEPCRGKPVDANHRSLVLEVATGVWRCWRCETWGVTLERERDWQARRGQPGRAASVHRARPRETLTPDPEPGKAPTAPRVPEILADLAPLAGTPGEAYLRRRRLGAALDAPDGGESLAARAGVRYARRFLGRRPESFRPGVVYPLHDLEGRVVALSCRHFDGRAPEKPIAGDGSQGAFFLPSWREAVQAPPATPVVVCEGPTTALAIAIALQYVASGAPWVVVALTGTNPTYWLSRLTGFRRVYLATDADQGGDRAAVEIASDLEAFGATCLRLRPPTTPPRNDWAHVLEDVGGHPQALAAVLADLAPELAARAAGAGQGAGQDTRSPGPAAPPPAVGTAAIKEDDVVSVTSSVGGPGTAWPQSRVAVEGGQYCNGLSAFPVTGAVDDGPPSDRGARAEPDGALPPLRDRPRFVAGEFAVPVDPQTGATLGPPARVRAVLLNRENSTWWLLLDGADRTVSDAWLRPPSPIELASFA